MLATAVDQVDHVAVLAEHDPVSGAMPDSSAEPGVRAQVPPLPVYRHEVARLDHVEQVEQLTGGRVAGDVHLGHVLVHHHRAGPGQLVDDPVDGGLVAGHQRAGQHHGVAGARS